MSSWYGTNAYAKMGKKNKNQPADDAPQGSETYGEQRAPGGPSYQQQPQTQLPRRPQLRLETPSIDAPPPADGDTNTFSAPPLTSSPIAKYMPQGTVPAPSSHVAGGLKNFSMPQRTAAGPAPDMQSGLDQSPDEETVGLARGLSVVGERSKGSRNKAPPLPAPGSVQEESGLRPPRGGKSKIDPNTSFLLSPSPSSASPSPSSGGSARLSDPPSALRPGRGAHPLVPAKADSIADIHRAAEAAQNPGGGRPRRGGGIRLDTTVIGGQAPLLPEIQRGSPLTLGSAFPTSAVSSNSSKLKNSPLSASPPQNAGDVSPTGSAGRRSRRGTMDSMHMSHETIKPPPAAVPASPTVSRSSSTASNKRGQPTGTPPKDKRVSAISAHSARSMPPTNPGDVSPLKSDDESTKTSKAKRAGVGRRPTGPKKKGGRATP